MATETIINYVKACTDAFLFYQVKRQDIQGKKLLAINEKYYVADHGIRRSDLRQQHEGYQSHFGKYRLSGFYAVVIKVASAR